MLDIPGHPNPQPKEVTLDEIYDAAQGCVRCPLSDGNRMMEMGIGNEDARVLVLLESSDASCYKERMDTISELLDSAGLTLDDVYVTALIKCPVPPGRIPTQSEIDGCSAILREEIRSVWPEIIITMGSIPTQFILHSEVGVDRLEGRMYRRGHFQVLPTFHIEQLMRDSLSRDIVKKTMVKLGDWLDKNPR